MDNNVFRYFMEWLRLEIALKHYTKWLDDHIYSFFAVGAPLLGSAEAVKAALYGVILCLPVFEGRKIYQTYECDEEEFRSYYSGWPANIINIEIPSTNGFDAYPSVTEIAETNLTSMECGIPSLLSFGAREISDETFFKAIEEYDPDSKMLLHQLEKLVTVLLQVANRIHNQMITDIIYENEGTLVSRSGILVDGTPGTASGDETVPYHSLSWGKNWLGSKAEHDGSDVQLKLNIKHQHGADIIPNMTRAPGVKYITFYEDAESNQGKRTAVWELDKAKRGPLGNADCYRDYGKARCAWPDHCEYRYSFGDVHLGQSCRLRNSSGDMQLHNVLDNSSKLNASVAESLMKSLFLVFRALLRTSWSLNTRTPRIIQPFLSGNHKTLGNPTVDKNKFLDFVLREFESR